MSKRERPGYLRNFGSVSTTVRKPTRLGEREDTRPPPTPKYYKAFSQLEIGKSYSEIRDEKTGLLRKTMKKPKSIGKLEKVYLIVEDAKTKSKSLKPITLENGIIKGDVDPTSPFDKFRFVFTKLEGRKNTPTELEVLRTEINKRQKKFILNCPKGGYGTRRAASKVRRHTRRRLPSK